MTVVETSLGEEELALIKTLNRSELAEVRRRAGLREAQHLHARWAGDRRRWTGR
jgi:hypothetical protein